MDVEGDAVLVHQAGEIDPTDPVPMDTLARRLGLGVRSMARLVNGAPGALTRVGDRWTIWVLRGLPPERRAFVVGHEIAEWWLRTHYGVEDLEERCNALGAAIVAPRLAMLALLRELGPQPRALAEAFGVTETCATLRMLEVTGRPGVVVSPPAVRVRGEPWGWPPHEHELRRLARARRLPPSVERVPISDERGRVALLAVA